MSLQTCALRSLNGRWAVAVPGVLGLGLIGFGLILQLVEGVIPCPMCIMQRWVWISIISISVVGAWWYGPRRALVFHGLHAVLGMGGAYVAARQSWLQWYPPEVVSCGRDFYGIVDTFPLRQALPLLLKGSGDCSAVDWTFLGGSIANWSFVMFVVAVAYSLWKLGQGFMHRSSQL
jgi:disulfide bond formation protein DsbB